MLTLSASCKSYNFDNIKKESLDINWEEIIVTNDNYIVLDELYSKNHTLISKYFEYIYEYSIDELFFINQKDKSNYNTLKKEYENIDYVNALCLNVGDSYTSMCIECYNVEDALALEKILNKRMPDEWIKYKNLVIRLSGAFIILLEGEYKLYGDATFNKNKQIFIMNHSDSYNSPFLKIPNNTVYLSYVACKNNKFLKQFYCNETLIRIGKGAFYNCSSLETVSLNHNLKQIDDRAFYGCPLLNIIVPKCVQKIGEEVFTSGNIFCEAESKPEGWHDGFYTGTAKVYYKGQWDYDNEGNPYVVNIDE